VNGILFDLGLSSLQLNGSNRGFSFQHDAPLDMRFSPSQEVTAADIINQSSEAELAHIIRTYGEEARSHKIARYLAKERPIKTTLQLALVIEHAIGGRKGRIHPATKTFQALRIAVNHELENLESALIQAVKLLGFGGRLVVISYHSLEDRIVKHFMRKESRDCICPPGTPTCVCGHSACLRLVSKKVITPSPQEVELNPRSRSAKLRVAECIVFQDEYCETAEKLCVLVENRANGWRRPVLLNKLRMAFLAS
jgi:16S rRNA (cytosine1402-N4)-methyltransferase